MAGRWALGANFNFKDYGSTLSTSLGTTLTAGGSANTKGSYSQLTASTSYDCTGIIVMLSNPSAGQGTNSYSIDIAIGASGSERIIIADMISASGTTICAHVFFPIQIPLGTRIAARCQCTTASGTIKCSVLLVDGDVDDECLTNCTTYGFQSGATLGAAVDPGGTADTKGAYTQLVASTTYDIGAIIAAFDQQDSGGTGNVMMDIAIGAAGSEVVIIPNLALNEGANSISPPWTEPIPTHIPAGSRIAARCQSSNINATTRKIGVTFYGLSL